jgi:hypothetical protein
MTKITDKGGNIHFHAVVPTYTAPAISERFFDDNGEENYILENGHTTLANQYNNIWHPCKGKIDMKAKGDMIDSPQRIF